MGNTPAANAGEENMPWYGKEFPRRYGRTPGHIIARGVSGGTALYCLHYAGKKMCDDNPLRFSFFVFRRSRAFLSLIRERLLRSSHASFGHRKRRNAYTEVRSALPCPSYSRKIRHAKINFGAQLKIAPRK